MMFLKFHKFDEKTCVGVSFYIDKSVFLKRPTTLLKKTPTQVFSREICEIFKDTFFTEHLRWLLVT